MSEPTPDTTEPTSEPTSEPTRDPHTTPEEGDALTPPSGAPEALSNEDTDTIQATEHPREEDPYQLRSGVHPEGGTGDNDPASQMNF